MTNRYRVGDVLLWKRAAGSVMCEVLEIKTVKAVQRACLRIAGWLGTHWETLDHTFDLAERGDTVATQEITVANGSRATCAAFLRSNGLRYYGEQKGWRAAKRRGIIAFVRGHYVACVYPVNA